MTANQIFPTKPEDMFCFAIYSASHIVNRAYIPLLKEIGLTYPQYIALTCLWDQDGQKVGDISRRLHMESSTLTPLLKRLEQLGHIRRKRGKDDERQVFVHLTESGKKLQKKAPDVTACMLEATGMDMVTLGRLVESLTRLTGNIVDSRTKD